MFNDGQKHPSVNEIYVKFKLSMEEGGHGGVLSRSNEQKKSKSRSNEEKKRKSRITEKDETSYSGKMIVLLNNIIIIYLYSYSRYTYIIDLIDTSLNPLLAIGQYIFVS